MGLYFDISNSMILRSLGPKRRHIRRSLTELPTTQHLILTQMAGQVRLKTRPQTVHHQPCTNQLEIDMKVILLMIVQRFLVIAQRPLVIAQRLRKPKKVAVAKNDIRPTKMHKDILKENMTTNYWAGT